MRNEFGQFVKGHKGIGNVFQKGHVVSENSKLRSQEVNTGQARNWKGGRIIESGYVYIKKRFHPSADHRGYIREHRLVVEECIGRNLLSSESVHHLDEIKVNNQLSNLMAFTTESAHQRFHYDPNSVNPSEIIFDGRVFK